MIFIKMPGRSYTGPLPPLSPREVELRDRLQAHVGTLAGAIGERNLWRYAALEAAADYIHDTFGGAGHAVLDHPYTVDGRTVRNLEVVRAGVSHARGAAEGSAGESPGESVVVGAHYDTVRGSPGANDNGTGVAAVLELARLFSAQRFARTVRLIAFVNEECPFAYTEHMGSLVYARRAASRGERITAMLSLETIGCYCDQAYSQRYPAPFGLFYPSTGNFIGFVGNVGSRRLVRRAVASFRRHTRFPCEGTAAPAWLPGIAWSDHWSFWQQGYPAIMVTDTAPFRYAQYHTAADRPERIDYDRFARVVAGVARVVAELASDGRSPARP